MSMSGYGPVERQCWQKQRYKTEAKAKQAARRNQWRALLPLKVYHCPICKGWHVSKILRKDAAR
jgi:hypothetical protein